jgi:hypothetical protein
MGETEDYVINNLTHSGYCCGDVNIAVDSVFGKFNHGRLRKVTGRSYFFRKHCVCGSDDNGNGQGQFTNVT